MVVCALACYKGICARRGIPEPVLLWLGGLNWLKVLSFSPFLASDRELSKSIGLFLPLLCHIRLPVTRAFRGENTAIASCEDVEEIITAVPEAFGRKRIFRVQLTNAGQSNHRLYSGQAAIRQSYHRPMSAAVVMLEMKVLDLRSDCTIDYNPVPGSENSLPALISVKKASL